MNTIKTLIEQYGATGILSIDSGNGTRGIAWVDADSENFEKYENTGMWKHNGELTTEELSEMRYIMEDENYTPSYISDWIGDENFKIRFVF